MTAELFRILVVEDDELQRRALARLLEPHGMVVAVETVADGLHWLGLDIKPDLVVTDWELPDGTGRAIVAATEAAGEIPTVVYTGAPALAHAEDLRGDVMVIAKGNVDQLRTLVTEAAADHMGRTEEEYYAPSLDECQAKRRGS